MNIEVLKENLSEETYAAVAEELKDKDVKLADLSKGEYVSKGKYDALETQLNNTQTLLDNKNTEYDALIAKAGDNEALKDELESLKTTSKNELDNLKAQYEGKLKTAAVMAEIAKANAKDPADIIPHMNMDAVTFDGEKVIGLAEQIETIKTAKPYLFAEQKQGGASGLDHGNTGNTAEENRMRAIMGLPPIK